MKVLLVSWSLGNPGRKLLEDDRIGFHRRCALGDDPCGDVLSYPLSAIRKRIGENVWMPCRILCNGVRSTRGYGRETDAASDLRKRSPLSARSRGRKSLAQRTKMA